MLQQKTGEIVVRTRGRGLYEVTRELSEFVAESRIHTGLLTVHIRHTSASLLIQENADPDVRRDLDEFFARLAPEGADWYVHTAEGRDDMPAHIRSALTPVNLSLPIIGARLALGTWQGIYVWEHRRAPHRRQLALHLIGE